MIKTDPLINGEFLKILIENSNEILTVIAKDGTIKYESPAVKKILGYDWDAESEVPFSEWVHPEDREIINKSFEDALKNPGKPILVACKLIKKSGEAICTEGTVTNMMHVPSINGLVLNFTDISQRKKAEMALVKSREKFLSLVNTVNGIIWEADIEPFRSTFISKQAEEILGYSVEEWVNEPFFWESHIHPEDKHRILDTYIKYTSKNIFYDFEYRMIASDGRIVWFSDKVTAIFKDGKPKYLRGIMVDITNQKNAEEKLKVKEQYYKNLVKQSSSAIILLDAEGKFLYQSFAVEKILGYTVEEESHTSAFQFVHPDDIAEVNKLYEDLLKHPGKSATREFRFLHHDGHYLWIAGTITNLLHDEGIKALILNYHDISERRSAQAELEKSEANLHTIFDNSDTGFILMDKNLQIVSFNKPAEKFSEEDLFKTLLTGKDAIEYFSKERQAFMRKKLKDALNGKPMNNEIRYPQVDGTERWYYMRFYPVYNQEKKVFGVVMALNDVTERKTSELQRQKITHELLQRNKAQEQFTFIVSHNLRSPVANILGVSKLLQGDDLDNEEKNEMMKGLVSSAKKLDEVIVDLSQILNITKNVKENEETVKFSNLVKDIENNLADVIENKDIKIITNFSESDQMVTVKSYLNSVFYNLISNSIKYRRQDIQTKIEITSSYKNNNLQLNFKDNGLGIDLKQKGDQVFGLYKRFHKNVEGRGMGLYMVKAQVESLGGKISLSSKINEGTEFLITFSS
jgi:PAS domain S-box-containing protein